MKSVMNHKEDQGKMRFENMKMDLKSIESHQSSRNYTEDDSCVF